MDEIIVSPILDQDGRERAFRKTGALGNRVPVAFCAGRWAACEFVPRDPDNFS